MERIILGTPQFLSIGRLNRRLPQSWAVFKLQLVIPHYKR